MSPVIWKKDDLPAHEWLTMPEHARPKLWIDTDDTPAVEDRGGDTLILTILVLVAIGAFGWAVGGF